MAVNEDLVEKLTPGADMGENESEEKNKILEGIAEVCMQQRQYHLATKKYTQAGNKVKVSFKLDLNNNRSWPIFIGSCLK